MKPLLPHLRLRTALGFSLGLSESAIGHDLASDDPHQSYDRTLKPPEPLFKQGTVTQNCAATGARAVRANRPSQAVPFEAFAPKVNVRWDEKFLYVESNDLPSHNMMVGTVYPLSSPLQITQSPRGVNREVLLAAMKDMMLASSSLNVVYTRSGGASEEGQRPPRREGGAGADDRRPPRPNTPRSASTRSSLTSRRISKARSSSGPRNWTFTTRSSSARKSRSPILMFRARPFAESHRYFTR